MRVSTLARAGFAAATLFLATGANGNWNATVVRTDGGHRIGNPDAKVQLKEFVSYTCPHCAHFARDGDGALQLAYIGPGKVSVEIRHIVRDPVDLTAALLTNCGPAAKFPRNHSAFMHSQDKWIGLLSTASQAQRQRWYNGDKAARFRAIASDFGFYRIMEQRGYSRSQADRCLADNKMADKLAADTKKNFETYSISSTPSFVLNGITLAGTHDWQLLQPQLDARF